MTDSKDYRIYLEAEFREIHKKLDSNEAQLDRIEVQTIKTNGCLNETVRDIEDLKIQRDKYLETRVSKDMLVEVKNSVIMLDSQVKEVKDSLLEYNFFRRYPKLTVVLIVVAVMAMSFSVYGAFKTVSNGNVLNRIEKIEQVK